MSDLIDRGVAPGLRSRFTAALVGRPLVSLFVATLAVSLLFRAVPGIDLAVSGWFHVAGEGFPAASSPTLVGVRRFGMAVFVASMLVALIGILHPLVTRGHRLLMEPRTALYLITAAVIGPWLLVNVLLKEHWARVRPRNLEIFGGDGAFTRAWDIAGTCRSNCSFVSGEASTAILLLALLPVVPAAWRGRFAAFGMVYAVIISANRIAFGGHFLSDVVISWLLTLMVIVVAYRAVFASRWLGSNEAIAAWLGEAGVRIAGRVRRALPGQSTR